MNGKFEKTLIVKEFEVLATALKQIQESVNPGKIDPAGASEASL